MNSPRVNRPSPLIIGDMDNHLQHLQITPLQGPAQQLQELPASARVVMNVLAHTEAPVPSPASSYVELFAQIAALQAKGDYYGLIQAAERADLAVCPLLSYFKDGDSLILPPSLQVTNDNHPTRLLITLPLVLSYLIVNDLPAEFDLSVDYYLTTDFIQTFSEIRIATPARCRSFSPYYSSTSEFVRFCVGEAL